MTPLDRLALDRLEKGRNAASEARYEEALNEYVWFHEHSLEDCPSVCGVRLSFALFYWAELAMQYPKARTVLKEIRDAKAQRVLAGEADCELFQDVVCINESAFSDKATYDLFVAIAHSFPETASEFAHLAMPAIVRMRDFELARRYLPSPTDDLGRISDHLNVKVKDLDYRPATQRAPCLEAYISNYVKDVKRLLEVLRGSGDPEQADRMQKLASELVESPDVRQAVWASLVSADPPRGSIPEFGRN